MQLPGTSVKVSGDAIRLVPPDERLQVLPMGADHIDLTVKDHTVQGAGPGNTSLQMPENSDLCAVYWAERHFEQLPAPPGEIAFRVPVGGGGSAPLTYKAYQATLRIFAEKAEMGPESVSSHSLRRDGCTFLSLCGATIEELRSRGDWCTDTVFTYLKTPLSI